MSLDWSVTNVENYKELCWIENDDETFSLNPVTEGIIFSMMGIDMGSITEANWEKFYTRLHIWETVNGTMLNKWDDGVKEPRPITPQEVRAHIGLSANVSTITDAAFRKKVFEALEYKAMSKLQREMVGCS